MCDCFETIDEIGNIISITDLTEKDTPSNIGDANQNKTNKTNIKKIKYKLKRGVIEDYDKIKSLRLGKYICEINGSINFFEYKFSKPLDGYPHTKILYEWCVIVKTSNNQTYTIAIAPNASSKEEIIEGDKTYCDFKKWYIYGDTYEYLDYTKLSKLFDFEYKNFLKRQEKIKKKNETDKKKSNTLNNTVNVQNNYVQNNYVRDNMSNQNGITPNKFIRQDKLQYKLQDKLIDENKYNNLDKEKFSELSDDDLACILFTRFKNSSNPLIREALIIHRTLSEQKNNGAQKNNGDEKNNGTEINKNKRDKSKYNNKKNKN